MVPSAFVLLEAFPLTPNGKVDRRSLPAPMYTRPGLHETFAAPSTSTEEVVTGIWSRVLGIEQIGIHDDFFALGGDSLRAMQVISRLRRALQVHLPLARFFKARTIAELARVIEQVKASDAEPRQREEKVPGSWPSVVEVQVGGSRQPFFYLHGDFLNGASYCFPLVRNLGPDQPFYALEPYKFDTLGTPPTLEAMAAAHLESMRSIQPKGPYLLGGFCNGALVAYEMARQLHAEEETVDLLILIDPNPVGQRRLTRLAIQCLGKLMRLGQDKQLYWFLWLRHLHRYLQHMYRYLRFPRYRKFKTERDSERADQNGMAIITLVNEYGLWLHHGTERLGSDEQKAPGRRGNGVGFTLPRLKDLFPEALFPTVGALRRDWEGIFFWAIYEYEPSFYPGKSTFFFTKDGQERGEDVEWRRVAEAIDKEVEIHHLAGRHDTCKTIHLLDLTEHLRLCLNGVQVAAPV
jgi:acyl carrier protein